LVAAAKTELDSFDTIEGLAIRGGPQAAVLTGISLHGGLPAAWTVRAVSAKAVVDALVEHWRSAGLPGYAQFDNDNRFQGPRQYADTVGRVIRLCLSLGVTPIFAPPNETGFQAAIESYNGRWQAKVWSRFKHPSIPGPAERSSKYVAAARQRSAALDVAERLGQFIDEIGRRDGVLGVSAVGVIAGELGRLAEIFLSLGAEAALAARVAQPGDAHPPANLQRLRNRKRLMRSRKRRTQLVDRADDLVAGDDRQLLLGQIPLDHVQVGAADRATADANPHLARGRLGRRQIDQFQRRRIDRRDTAKEHGFHGNSRPPDSDYSGYCVRRMIFTRW